MIISLLLAATTASGATAATTPVEPAKEKLICRRSVDTGSLVKGRRECRTKGQWEQIAMAARAGAAYVIENNQGRPGGN